jgi:ferredoxin-NADP reductase
MRCPRPTRRATSIASKWSKLDTAWQGVLIDDVLAAAGLDGSPTPFTLAHSYDGYSTNVPAADLGGGSGVVPLMSMIRHRAAQGSGVPDLLFYSARSWDEIIFRDELIALHDRRDGFELVFALTREPARRERDYSRRIDDDITAELLTRLPQAPNRVYICGANPFVEAASQGAITSGIAPNIIRTERYGG